jgi:hypothetical protein
MGSFPHNSMDIKDSSKNIYGCNTMTDLSYILAGVVIYLVGTLVATHIVAKRDDMDNVVESVILWPLALCFFLIFQMVILVTYPYHKIYQRSKLKAQEQLEVDKWLNS